MRHVILSRIAIFAFIIGVNFTSFGQPPSGPPPGGSTPAGNTPPCWDPECVPIDGGLGFLIAAGALLGIRTFKNKKAAK